MRLTTTLSPFIYFVASFFFGDLPDKDLAFIEIQEQWVIDTLPEGKRNLNLYFNSRMVNYIRMLGCEHHRCRETAASLLEDMGESAFRILVWGTRSLDPEIAFRCESMLVPYYKCFLCEGRGYPNWDYTCKRVCENCRGQGHVRPNFSRKGKSEL